MTPDEFDHVCELPYTWVQHWSYREKIPAWETTSNSLTVVRGCPGGCAFCGLVCHQGRQLVSRSVASVIRSVRRLVKLPSFHGTITDIGGAAGNIYGHHPDNPELCRHCRRFSCIFPEMCRNYVCDQKPLMDLICEIRKIPEVKHLYINSGLRLDLALRQPQQTEMILKDHVGGQVSVAPEHLDGTVLRLMRKGKPGEFEQFKEIFDRVNRQTGKKQFMVPYFISNFPGCTERQMRVVDDYLARQHWSPQQVQDFIPVAMTMGTAMYCSETAPDGTPLTVRKGLAERRTQRNMLRASGRPSSRSERDARTSRKIGRDSSSHPPRH